MKKKSITINITNLLGTLVIIGDVTSEKSKEIKQDILNALLTAVKDIDEMPADKEKQE